MAKTNLVFKGSDKEDDEKETDKEETDDDKMQTLMGNASYSELYLDEKDFKYMVPGNDGWYYWAVINPNISGWWEIRFHYNGSRVYDEQIIQNVTSWEPWKDYFGRYVFCAETISGWNDHDVYSLIGGIAYSNAITYGSDGHINVRLDADMLDCWSAAQPTRNMYIKDGNNTTLNNYIGNSSWSQNKAEGWGAILHLENGTMSLRTRGIVFDGVDHYNLIFSICANAVYVSDGASYYSYNDEFKHGYTSAILSNHHTRSTTTQYGESYVNVDSGYIHDCLIGVGVNNRADISNTTFENCVCAIDMGGSETLNGMPWGSRGNITNCTITSNISGNVRGENASGIAIKGKWKDTSRCVNVLMSKINTASDGIYIEPQSNRNILIEKTNILGGNNSSGIYSNNPGVTIVQDTNIYKKNTGIKCQGGNITVTNTDIYSNNFLLSNLLQH